MANAPQNFTIAVPIDYTVGYGGGWTLGGGHGLLTSLLGLGADQVLSMNVILANGVFVTADVNQNPELFFALRGGGGSKFETITSYHYAGVQPSPQLYMFRASLLRSLSPYPETRPLTSISDTRYFRNCHFIRRQSPTSDHVPRRCQLLLHNRPN
jgi:hypothetical protein